VNESTEDMKSFGEILDQMGLGNQGKPREPMKIDYEFEAKRHWEEQKPKIWAILLANSVPIKMVNDLQELMGNGRFEASEAVSAVESFLGEPGFLMMLMGSPQIGKSLACAYGLSTGTVTRRTQFGGEEWRTWRYWDSDFRWVNYSRLGIYRQQFDVEARAECKKLETAKLLVIDDFGASTFEDNSKAFCTLVDRRWSSNLKTMVTTNLTDNEIRDNVDARILQRIVTNGKVVECRWDRQ
jgi:hypothetical protein